MDEGITFDPMGTITVEFDDKTYRLTRPKMGQWRHFSRKLQGLYDENREHLLKLTEDAQKEGPKQEKAQAALREYQSQPFYESTIPWLREVFSQLGDKKLPESDDDWPAWLAADLSIPTQIVAHWRTSPKASGATS
jgi:hypothetical protein